MIWPKSSQAPQLLWLDGSDKLRKVRFDGVDDANGHPILIDRKTSAMPNADKEMDALRQSQALHQNGYTGRWELPNAYEATRARRMFARLGITNITVQVVPR